MSTDMDMKSAISDFHSLLKRYSGPIYLECLIQSFEKSLIQKERISGTRFFKTLAYASLFKHVPNVCAEKNTFYFWPFQFHHCDFLVPVIKHLQESDVQVRMMILRPNLIPYLKNKGVDGAMVQVQQKLRSPLSWFKRFLSGLRFYRAVKCYRQSAEWKRGAMAAFENISLAEQTRSIAEHVSRPNSGQYHIVGHDISLQGKTIINAVNKLGLTSARIQNGAVNYLLCQYSEICEIFFWDNLSKRAYEQNSWKGIAHIVGNQKLWEKQSKGVNKEWHKWLYGNHLFLKRIMVAFSGPGYKTTVQGHIKSLKYLFQLVKALPEIGFIIKLHPKDRVEYYKDLAKCSNVVVTANLYKDLQPDALDVLMVSDLLITGGSTVALDAMSQDIPVISIDPLGEMEQFEFLKAPGVTVWKLSNQLSDICELAKQFLAIDRANRRLTQNPAECIAQILRKRNIKR